LGPYPAASALRPGYAVARLAQYVTRSIEAARFETHPFEHLVFDHVLPDDLYPALLEAMPAASDYRPMSGRSKTLDAQDGTHTRVKIDLFPEYVRHLPPQQRELWAMVGGALRSEQVKQAFVRRLAPGLARRFGPDFANVGMWSIPILTRDVPGYRIPPHTDTHWKGITVQIYLPPHDRWADVGTIFHKRLPDGSLPKTRQMQFAPNSGYAFAVADDTWHSADPVGSHVTSRDSILLTYFVDAGLLRMVRNRGKRLTNFVLNEARYLLPARSSSGTA
jgi:hypothetical protein